MLSGRVREQIKRYIVLDDALVEVGNPEVPDFLFISTSINNWKVRVRWVRE